MSKYRPKVVVIEFNPTIPPNIEYVQKKNYKINQGNSLKSIYLLAKSKGYELISTTTVNAFFVDKKYFDIFGIKSNSPEIIQTSKEYFTGIFQLYDGKLLLYGYDNLFWHKIKITNSDIQVLPRLLRKFPGSMGNFTFILFRIWRKIRKIALKINSL